MDLTKDPALLLLLRTLQPDARGWVIEDQWEPDLCAVGIVSPRHPDRLVYLTIWDVPDDDVSYDFDVVSEAPGGWTTVEHAVVKRAALAGHLERFLGAPRAGT